MFAYLTIDQGNSSTKAALWQHGGISDRFCVRDGDFQAIKNLIAGCRMPVKAALCSVAESQNNMLMSLKRLGIDTLDINCRTPMPLKIRYSTPETLGADRIAAAMGAFELHGGSNILVADIGSAATYDLVTADGQYLGGNISPGLGMRLRALNSFTARLPLVDAYDGPAKMFGSDTREALRSGAVYGVVAELEFYARQAGPDAKIMVTGGWADMISRYTSVECIVNHDLVLIGLNSILAYNEAKISC
ncbi:MAG: type III pantothenate kinase [Muribaculaceae bacterium]|nr:type III pantothenate kinase [Muribaculaceae bacterium]MDE6332359.1 type III pantothenate kinase [Muribaculaceae bacterium]